jgi:hypothetical protein
VTAAGPADPETALQTLIEAGVAPDRAAGFIADGMVAELAGLLIVLGETIEPITGDCQLIVPFATGDLLGDVGRTEAFQQLAGRLHPAARTAVLRVPAGAPTPVGPARRLSSYLAADAVPEPPAADGWSVRPYRPADRADVAALLVRAFLVGYQGSAAEPDPVEVRGYVAGLLDQVGDRVAIFCAERDGAFAGHATLGWDEDELTGEERPELIDLYVLESLRGSPAAGLLTAAAVRWAAAAGHPLRGNVTGGDDAALVVLDRLCERGWYLTESYWLLDLP